MIIIFFFRIIASKKDQKLIANTTTFRVRYADTDQMGYMYYGNYAQYLEEGRTEWLRKLGFSYKRMEEEGIILPVKNMEIRYLKPIKYDDFITLKTTLAKEPMVKIEFLYELYNEQNELCTTASTTLVFVDISTKRPRKIPQKLLQKILLQYRGDKPVISS